MRSPLALLETKDGWKSVQTERAARGISAKTVVFVREPTVAEIQSLKMCVKRSKGRMHILGDMVAEAQGAEKEIMVTVEWDEPRGPRKVFAGVRSLKGRPVDRLTVHRPLTKEEYNSCYPLIGVNAPAMYPPPVWRMQDGPWRPWTEFTTENIVDG